MKKILLIIVSLLLISNETPKAQDIASANTVVTSLSASAGGASTAGTPFSTPGNPTSMITWTTSYSSAPASVTILLQGSLDNSTYYTLDTSTNVNGEIRNFVTAARFFRCFISAKSGGGTTTCSAVTKSAIGHSITGQMLFAAGTAAVPSISFTTDPTSGFYRAGSNAINLALNGGDNLVFGLGGPILANGTAVRWGTITSGVGVADSHIGRIAAGQIYAGTLTTQPVINGTLTTSTTSTCTIADLLETDLWTYTLPANALNADGRGFRVNIWGTFAATANNKTIRLYYGGTLINTTGPGPINNATWRLDAVMIRTGASAESGLVQSSYASTLNSTANPVTAIDTTLASIIKVSGQNGVAAANDICVKGAMVETIK